MKKLIVALLLIIPTVALAEFKEPMVRVEITRSIPYDKDYHIVREFDDLDELVMWFNNKMENEGCDPYVTKVTLFPKGK